ncbi:PH domain-containing protein [Halalkalibacterium halodurans]|uniref:BH2095 protein n=2 Tax=Halalkalibacterium halodurans TaxID=86665 RepID=Q9KB40_HALH5|nr:PH domain-containing protein [Halalkalibacterium halodurans]MDY7222645.1 PH domain-containing protein [Halalkalibacterium halodurans]MDY7241866.1 PH domain-containing protein [Halalkalibacterium halodurans]MED3648864.1 PH domain-containing protein [Halalkalibacterium halodurans]MED4082468.1 PH domain-containing protein [Halalkalibacterium halodurans]MED4085027.1 PH domain-containing protein [Halalkalibacterium halodurans]
MFKKIASDALGISDIGKIIRPEDFDKTESDDYVLHEDGENIHFLIKSKTDEYCFTNRSLIHLDGAKATSSKRNIYRYDYYLFPIRNIMIETAGTIDLDLEIKFTIGEKAFSVDIDRREGEAIADLYKSLVAISHIQIEQDRRKDYAKSGLTYSKELFTDNRFHDGTISEEFEKATKFAFDWLDTTYNENTRKDFGDVFSKYIQN